MFCWPTYLNACGADFSGRTGESHIPETHLIPLIMAAAAGDREDIKIYGSDYDTKDGTCVRDYIHTLDLASAHIKAMEIMLESENSLHEAINLGTKDGYTVREVIEMVKEVTGKDFKVVETDRRAGDPDKLIANNQKAKEVLGWEPRYSDLKTIVQSAWDYYPKAQEVRKTKTKK